MCATGEELVCWGRRVLHAAAEDVVCCSRGCCVLRESMLTSSGNVACLQEGQLCSVRQGGQAAALCNRMQMHWPALHSRDGLARVCDLSNLSCAAGGELVCSKKS